MASSVYKQGYKGSKRYIRAVITKTVRHVDRCRRRRCARPSLRRARRLMDRGGSGRPFLLLEVAMHRPVLVTPPAILPVSLDEAKAHLRLVARGPMAKSCQTTTTMFVKGLIAAATDHLDGWTGILGRCLVEQTWRQDFEAFAPCLSLPLGPVISITSVTVAGELIDSGSYALKTDVGGRARVEVDGAAASGAVSITYKAGYATIPAVPAEPGPEAPAKTTVPPAIKTAILLLVGAWYENREETAIGVSVAALPNSVAVHALLAPYRRIGV